MINSTKDRDQQSRKSFLWDAFQLGSGTALAQILTILAVPILSRMYSPEVFGITGLFISLVTIFSTISGLRYDLAIVLPEKESDGFALLQVHMGFTILMGVITGLIFGFGRHLIADWFNSPHLASYLWYAGPAVIIFGLMNGLNYWNTRRKRFKLLAATKLINNASMVFVQLSLAILGYPIAGALIGGNVLGKFLEDIVQGYKTIFDAKKSTLFSKNRSELFSLMVRYKKFPIYNTWAALVNTLSWYVPSFLLAVFFSPTVVGFYVVGERVIRAPMQLVGHAFSQVFFQRGALAVNDGSLGHLFLETIQILTKILLIPTVVLTLLGKDIFIIFLGSQWAEAGIYVQILGMWAFLWFLASPTSPIMSITENQEKALIFNIVNLAARLLSLLIGGFLKSPVIALVLFSISGILTYGWLLIWVGTMANIPWHRTLLKICGPDLIWGVLMALILIVLKFMQLSSLWLVLIAILIMLVYYSFVLKHYKHLFVKR